MKHRKNSFDDKKERYHNKRFAGLLQERFQYSSKFLRFYQGTEKVLRNAEKYDSCRNCTRPCRKCGLHIVQKTQFAKNWN